ncbi:unnamed protein product [Rhizophagus irregularis]|nr:unnamed protein product [Rhizophagus irregularis]CAB5190178.1 unnamed protein product [Rhizophagus irregularis]
MGELLDIPKINQYFRSILSENLLFRKEKKVREGYDFNEYEEINLSDNNIEYLRYWPSDVEIDNAISTGYERAIHLARYLEMTAIPNDAHYFNIHKRFPTSQLEDFWENNPNFRTTDNELDLDSLSISQYINCAISKMNPKEEDSQVAFLLEKTYETCQVIEELIQKLPDIPWFLNNSESDFNYILSDESLNIKFFLNLCQCHDAYSNKKLERTRSVTRNNNNENNASNKFDINKASSLVSYLTKNETTSIKSQENRWKLSRKTNNIFKEKISSASGNLFKQHLSCANIAIFPLQIRSFVIAIFNNTFCVAQIIAMYEQNASIHLYIDMPISKLKSLFYVSMKIFFHINGAIFSEIRNHSFCIFSHIEPLHIIHHLASKDISINEEALILKGQAKKTFNTLNKK